MQYVALFFCGMLLCNSIPHVVCGLQGKPFPTPFARPSGVGYSSPLVNFLWGFANLVAALVLLSRNPFPFGTNAALASVLVGALLIGVFTARHFGAVEAKRNG